MSRESKWEEALQGAGALDERSSSLMVDAVALADSTYVPRGATTRPGDQYMHFASPQVEQAFRLTQKLHGAVGVLKLVIISNISRESRLKLEKIVATQGYWNDEK